tara:strand:- start:4129 stop:4827 length:699 start_codon:yes stop_codon:yes gene_type:complete
MNFVNNFGRVLILAAHADDETLGCGGTISKLISEGLSCHIHIVTGIGESTHPIFTKQKIENIREEFKKAIKHIGSPKFSFGNLPAAMLNDISTYKINKEVKDILEKSNPNTIFMPSRNDLHLDHKIINYALKVAARPYLKNNQNLKSIIEYEVPSETNIYSENPYDIFTPNLYIDISNFIEYKLKAFAEYKSQIQEFNQPRSLEGIKTLASYRGINIGVKFAESFNIIFKRV